MCHTYIPYVNVIYEVSLFLLCWLPMILDLYQNCVFRSDVVKLYNDFKLNPANQKWALTSTQTIAFVLNKVCSNTAKTIRCAPQDFPYLTQMTSQMVATKINLGLLHWISFTHQLPNMRSVQVSLLEISHLYHTQNQTYLNVHDYKRSNFIKENKEKKPSQTEMIG